MKHRYKEFDALHTQLVLNHGLRKDLLPAKKIIGNKDPEFIERRREDLEVYIKKIVQFLEKALPLEVCSFLEFEEYEVYSIIRKMAAEVYTTGETKLMTEKSLSMNPLQVNSSLVLAIHKKSIYIILASLTNQFFLLTLAEVILI